MANTVMGNMVAAANQIDVDVYARGDDGRGISSVTVEYQASESSTVVPTGEWSTEFITVPQGQFLWIRTTYYFTDDTTKVIYSISYFAIDGQDGENGAIFTPYVDGRGNISWTNDKGLPNPETVNIRGPQGLMGSVKFYYVNQLPVQNIELDAFYVKNAAAPTAQKLYDEYFYMNDHWEKLGEDTSGFYSKGEIDAMLEDYVATYINVTAASVNTTYYLTGTEQAGEEDPTLCRTGITYHKASGASLGTGAIDGEQITTSLFFSIS